MADQEKPATQTPAQLIEFARFTSELRENASAAVCLGVFNTLLDQICTFVNENPTTAWTAMSTIRARWGEIEGYLKISYSGGVETIMSQIFMTLRNSAPDPYVSRRIPPQGHNMPGR